MKRTLATLGLLALAGCGVKHEGVENKPPQIEHDAKVFDVAYGEFKVSLASVFFYPDNYTDQQTTDLVTAIRADSRVVTANLATIANLKPKIDGLRAQWNQIDCVTKYAVLGPNDDPMDVDTVTSWKADKDVADATALKEMQACKDNQSLRQALSVKYDAAKHDFAQKSDEVSHLLDTDINHPVNSQTIDFAHIQLRINADNSVVLSLPQLMTPGFSPSTSNGEIINAIYDPHLKLLKFDVLMPTQTYLHFELERMADMGNFGGFTGAMNLMNRQTIVRNGQAVIYFTPPTAP